MILNTENSCASFNKHQGEFTDVLRTGTFQPAFVHIQ